MDRRNFLKKSAATSGMTALGGGLSLFSMTDANAATEDYKCLVYVFLNGGNDGFNCFVPLDEFIYKTYSKARGPMAIKRSASDTGNDNGYLLPLDGSEHLGMHPAMAPLKEFWTDRSMAVIANVGPLVRPIVKAEYSALVQAGDPKQIPSQLFDHFGQQNCWHNAMGDPKIQAGWGAAALEEAGQGSSYSLTGSKRWGQSQLIQQVRLSFRALKYNEDALVPPVVKRPSFATMINTLVSSANASSSEIIKAWGGQEKSLIDVNKIIGPLLEKPPVAEIAAGFADAANVEFVQQMKRAAIIISARAQLGGVRDIICVGAGDYDTHASQIDRHPILLKDMSQAVAGFTKTMRLMGLSEKVTCMSASDFGRTLQPNSSDGTDHAWGSCHFVVGGAVKGQKTYGKWPDYTLGGPDDKGVGTDAKGSTIPTTSVNQYAATVLKWFLPQINLVQTLPDLVNFSVKDLGFMKRKTSSLAAMMLLLD
ncbi:MAG: DUF1501 domain-containing protein [Pseudomonadota bacterium]